MTEMAPQRFGLVLDCADPEVLVEFWSSALDYVNVGSAGAYVALYPREGNGPKLLLQRVDEPKQSKNRMHLDIEPQTFTPKPPDSLRSEPDLSARTPAASTAAPGS